MCDCVESGNGADDFQELDARDFQKLDRIRRPRVYQFLGAIGYNQSVDAAARGTKANQLKDESSSNPNLFELNSPGANLIRNEIAGQGF